MSSDKQTSSCIELSEIRKLDQLLTQCETSSCEHICRDCCAKLGSLEDITDHQDEEEAVEDLDCDAFVVSGRIKDDVDNGGEGETETRQDELGESQCADKIECDLIGTDRAATDKMLLVRLDNEGEDEGEGKGENEEEEGDDDEDDGAPLNLSEEVEKFCLKFEERDGAMEVPRRPRLFRNETLVTDNGTQCMEPLTCDRRLNHLTVNKATIWICDNCERRNRRSDQQRRHHGGGHKKHSLTINEKPTKLLRLQHKCSSENCLKHQSKTAAVRDSGGAIVQPQHHPHQFMSSLRQKPLPELRKSSPSCETTSGGKAVVVVPPKPPKSSPQMMSRRISCRIPDDLEAGAREALLGSRFGSLHEKKLPEPVETVCEFDYPWRGWRRRLSKVCFLLYDSS